MEFYVDPLKIDQDSPFQEDAFEREDFAKSLENILQDSNGKLVVAVDAAWGHGKTTFAKMWQHSLSKREEAPVHAIYVDAFSTDHEEDPLITFCGEINELAKQSSAASTDARTQLTKHAGAVGRFSASTVKALGMALMKQFAGGKGSEELMSASMELISGGSDLLGEVISHKVETYGETRKQEEDFKKAVAEIASQISGSQGGFPLTVFVDELDRCRPDYALRLLERIKHFFDVDNLAFVLFVNIRELTNTVKAAYGINQPDIYLKKFVHIRANFPPPTAVSYQNGLRKLLRRLFDALEFDRDRKDWEACTLEAARIVRPSLREIERAVVGIAITVSAHGLNKGTQNGPAGYAPLICFLACIRETDRELYDQIAAGKVTYADVVNRFGIVEEGDSPHFFAILKVGFAMEETDLSSLPEFTGTQFERMKLWVPGPKWGRLVSKTCREFLDQIQKV